MNLNINLNTILILILIVNGSDIEWKNINISLPLATGHQVVGYYLSADRVYLFGGENVGDEYWSLQFNESYNGWNRNAKYRFENLKLIEYSQSYVSSLHNVIYIKTNEFIHIYDMEIDYFNENVIELPIHLNNGCMTVYSDTNDKNIEYLIIIGSKTRHIIEPTTWIYKINQLTHNITFFDIGPDLIGLRQDFCCTILNNYLYIIGGIYNKNNTRFIEQWLIDINFVNNNDNNYNNFTNINTFINSNIAKYNLPQFGHRCIVNNNTNQIYVIGGITDQNEKYFNYSRYIFILKRENNSLYELNYRETLLEEEEEYNQHNGKILPSLPFEIAYTATIIDKYGYLNIFGGQLASEEYTNEWLRVNTNNNILMDNDNIDNSHETDVIWKNHKKHNHNEQWALLILLTMVILVGLWFKCIAKISKLRSRNRLNNSSNNNSNNNYTDATLYDEITGTSEIDDLEETEEGDDNSDDMYSHLHGIIANQSE